MKWIEPMLVRLSNPRAEGAMCVQGYTPNYRMSDCEAGGGAMFRGSAWE